MALIIGSIVKRLPPSRTHKPAAHGRTGLDTRRIASRASRSSRATMPRATSSRSSTT
ncbi:MAG: hypothetical protein ACLUQ6_09675 [Alistipes onderdonkii]